HAGVESLGMFPLWDDLPLILMTGICIHGELNILADLDFANIYFIDRCPDFHLAEVLGDEEKARGRQARNHRLADVDPAINDHTTDWRSDGSVIQIGPGGLHVGLGDADLGSANADIGGADPDVGSRYFDIRLVGVVLLLLDAAGCV